jgi:hypothetical protein
LKTLNAELGLTGVPDKTIDAMKSALINLDQTFGMVNHLSMDAANASITGITLFNYRDACGGQLSNSSQFSMCSTNLRNHNHASIVATYMSDGTSSSIALKKVQIREDLGPANLTWTFAALKAMMGGELSTTILPQTIPGSVNTLMWWSAVNLQGISPPFLEVGVETMYTLILRGKLPIFSNGYLMLILF